jgi:D-alanyl-lipoteichoic acid acyltransferase DltB (MBOAT superfamily)
MLFNSLEFPIFLAIVMTVYWLLPAGRLRLRNSFLLVASYVFYGWWDWRFLSLIFLSSLVDYQAGLHLVKSNSVRKRRRWLAASLFVNLGALGVFKYFNFFIDSFASLIESFGLQANLPTLQIILPVGISFYTFQTLSYTIDIYRGKLEPTKDAVAFFAFVSFFPQLVAGPIERAKSLLPQFLKVRTFDLASAADGARQMLWGLFKKVVIADNLAPMVEQTFTNYSALSGLELFIGVYLFAFQIYCDFSGYSDIAIGTARLFGFNLMRNFAYPYFSRDIGEFWRRWHISLSSWFRDYVYIPLGGSRVPKLMRIWNIVITFTISGFWHGANWTFVVWGLLNGLYYIPLMLTNKQKQHTDTVAENRLFPTLRETGAMALTFAMALLAWVFFRAQNLAHAFGYLGRMFSTSWLTSFEYETGIAWTIALVVIEWFGRNRQHGFDVSGFTAPVRWTLYILLSLVILLFGNFNRSEFIYFQF